MDFYNIVVVVCQTKFEIFNLLKYLSCAEDIMMSDGTIFMYEMQNI